MEASNNNIMVEVTDLKMYFPITRGLFRRKVGDVKAVDEISFEIKKHETLGLVGESGCGKTTAGRCILRLYNPTSGSIIFNGEDISTMKESKIKNLRRNMGVIFQDPFGSLNPRQTAGNIVGDPLKVHKMAEGKELKVRVTDLFKLVGRDPTLK